MKCNKCGAEILDNAAFCIKCGNKITAENAAPAANPAQTFQPAAPAAPVTPVAPEAQPAAPSAPVAQPAAPAAPVAQPAPAAPVNTVPPAQGTWQATDPAAPAAQGYYQAPAGGYVPAEAPKKEKKKGKGKKAVIAVIIAVLVLAILGVGAYFLFFNNSSKTTEMPAVYVTDTDLVVVNKLGKSAEKTVTTTLTNDYAGYYIFSENYKYIVYAQNADEEEETFDIYCKDLSKKDEAAVKIDSGVSTLSYLFGELDGIIYIKDEDICLSDAEGNKTTLSEDSYVTGITDDSRFILCYKENSEETKTTIGSYTYTSSTYDVFYINLSSGEIIPICEAVSRAQSSADINILAYLKDDVLYLADPSGESKEIAKDVSNFVVTVNHNIFYLGLDKEYALSDFVDDADKEADSKIKKPGWLKDYRPDLADFDSVDAYKAAVEKAKEKYYSDLDKYEAAEERNKLRTEIEKSEDKISSYSLYIYDGTTSRKAADNVSDFKGILDYSAKFGNGYYFGYVDAVKATIAGAALDQIEKVKLSDLESARDVKDYVESKLESEVSLATSSGLIQMGTEEEYPDRVMAFDDIFVLYYEDEETEDLYNIYTLTMDAKSSDDKQAVAEGTNLAAVMPDKKFISLTDYDKDYYAAVMKLGEEEIENVFPGFFLVADEKGFYYATNFDVYSGESTVYYWSEGKSSLIGEHIVFSDISFAVVDGKILTLTDYDIENLTGTLVCIDGENRYELAKGVKFVYNKIDIVPFYTSEEFSYYYSHYLEKFFNWDW